MQDDFNELANKCTRHKLYLNLSKWHMMKISRQRYKVMFLRNVVDKKRLYRKRLAGIVFVVFVDPA